MKQVLLTYICVFFFCLLPLLLPKVHVTLPLSLFLHFLLYV